jgi:hypothetical protein
MSDQYIRDAFAALRGRNTPRWILTPATTGAGAVGVVVTSGAGAWGLAADLIAAAAITAEHYIGGFYFNTAGAAQVFELQVGNATPATGTWFEARLDMAAATPNLQLLKIPFPVWRAANAQTSARTGGVAAKVLGVSTLYTLAL